MVDPKAILLALLVAGCAGSAPVATAPTPERPWREISAPSLEGPFYALSRSMNAEFARPDEDQSLVTELELAPAAIGDSTIEWLMRQRLALPAHVTVAVLQLRTTRPPRWWPIDQGDEVTEALAESTLAAVGRSARVGRGVPLPGLLVGPQESVSSLREAAARLQADVLLLYRPRCRMYQRQPFIGPAQYRAVCSVEAALLDTRSGLIPFATVITRQRVAQKEHGEFGSDETTRRTRLEALMDGLRDTGARVGEFLATVPVQ